MSKILMVLLFLLPSSFGVAGDFELSAKLSLKSKYLGKLATTVDSHSVLQPYVELSHSNGFYGYLWLNLPLKEGNPNRSLEVEPRIGYKKSLNDWTVDISLTLFDIQNPRVLDLDGDILGSRIMVSKGMFYLESIVYTADGGRDGLLGGFGAEKRLSRNFVLSAELNYVDGPFHFEPLAYGEIKAELTLDNSPVALFIEVMEVFHKTVRSEQREDRIAVGLSYAF